MLIHRWFFPSISIHRRSASIQMIFFEIFAVNRHVLLLIHYTVFYIRGSDVTHAHDKSRETHKWALIMRLIITLLIENPPVPIDCYM